MHTFSPLMRGLGLLAAFLLFLPASSSLAQDDALTSYQKSLTDELPERVEKALDHLLAAASDDMVRLDPEQIKPLLAFVDDNAINPDNLDMERRYGSDGMCREFTLDVGLARLLRYFVNPDIPYNLLMPGLVGQNSMRSGSDLLRLETPVWERLEGLADPMVLRGVEHEISVPTEGSGGWYAYDLDRLVVIMLFRGRPAMIQASVQRDRSSVGRKGVAIDQDDWQFFYSQETGLNRTGLGWADTYIYESAGIYVFLEDRDGAGIQVANLKWLSAGWKGINAVGSGDLLEGSEETVRSFDQVFSVWPEPEVLEAVARWARDMSEADLARLGRAYALDFEKLAQTSEDMDDDDFLEEVAQGGYAQVLGPEALRAQLGTERLKCLLGKPALGGVCAEPLPQPDKEPEEAELSEPSEPSETPEATDVPEATEAPADTQIP